MTGTSATCLHTNQSRSYLNHLVYRVLMGKSEGRGPLGRPKYRWEGNTKMCLKEIGWGWRGLEIGWGGVDWIRLRVWSVGSRLKFNVIQYGKFMPYIYIYIYIYIYMIYVLRVYIYI